MKLISDNIDAIKNVKMLNSLVICDSFFVVDDKENIFKARFVIDEENSHITFSLLNTQYKNDNCFISFAYYSKLYSLYANKENGEFGIDEINKNKICNLMQFDKCYYYKRKKETNDVTTKFIAMYSRFVSLYGNFDKAKTDLSDTFMESPQLFALNINNRNLQLIIENVLSLWNAKNKDKQYLFAYFVFLLNQNVNCLYNIGKLRNKEGEYEVKEMEQIEKFIKEFVLQFADLEMKSKNKILYTLSRLICNLDVNAKNSMFTVEEIAKILNEKKDKLTIKQKLLFLRILTNQKDTLTKCEVFKMISEIEYDIFAKQNIEYYFKHQGLIAKLTNEIFTNFYIHFNKEQINTHFSYISENFLKIANSLSQCKDFAKISKVVIHNNFTFKAMFFITQFAIQIKSTSFLLSNISILINIISALETISTKEETKFNKSEVYEIESSHPFNEIKSRIKTIKFNKPTNVIIRSDFSI